MKRTIIKVKANRRTEEMRTPKQIAEDIYYNRDNKAKLELEKMFGCKFDEMTVKQRRLGVAVLSATENYWNK